MASTVKRRPLPALVLLVALLLLSGLVWFRVLHRVTTADATPSSCPTPTTSATASATASLPAPASITVAVYNATKRAGIAAKARTALVEAGFKVPKPATNDTSKRVVTGTAQIRYGVSSKNGAALLRYYFPGATLVQLATRKPTVMVALGPRYQGVATTQAVQKALTGDKVSVASPSPRSTAGAKQC